MLAGLRVLDLATGAAAFAGRLLAEGGAEVTKAEVPGGEIGRRTPPFLDGASLFYRHYNAGKRHVTLAADDSALADLIASADVVIDGGPERPYGPPREGPIWASIVGFGAGPRQDWRATDLIAQAAGGMLFVTGEPNRPPLRAHGEQAHHLASQYLVSAILLALRTRRRTGKSQLIAISLQEAVASAIEHVMVRYVAEGVISERQGAFHWVRGYQIFRCQDGYVTISWNRNWDHLVALLDADDAAADLANPRYDDPLARDAANDHIQEVLAAWAADRPAEEIFEKGQLFRMPWAPVRRPAEVLTDPQLAARGYFTPDSDGLPLSRVLPVIRRL